MQKNNINIDRFYLPSLMRIEGLDVRGVAEKEKALTAISYIERISSFLADSAAVFDVLRNGGNLFLASDAKARLVSIGYHAFSSGFAKIISANATAEEKEELIAEFSAFIKKLKALRNPPKLFFEETGANSPAYISMLGQRLSDVLSRLDMEEKKRKLQILAVDDTSFMLQNISNILSDEYTVFTVAKPNLVEMFLDHIVPELFLLDYLMPYINGFELVPIIRARKEHAETPIIFLTSHGTMENISSAKSLGASDFILKPCKSELLREKVKNHIKRKETI